MAHDCIRLAGRLPECVYGPAPPTKEGSDLFSIGYYREGDPPIRSALAQGYTTFDSYFCSMRAASRPVACRSGS